MTLYLHIGTPKTGTTSIQHMMHRNAALLGREHSLYYPTLRLNHWAMILPFISEEQYPPLTNHVLRRLGTRESFMAQGRQFTGELAKAAKRYRTHVVSAEQLLITHSEPVARFRDFLAGQGFDTKIVVYVRHPAERLSSVVSQQLRGGQADLASMPIIDNITPAIRNYTDVFGRENMIVRQFGERYFRNGDLIDDFTAIINGGTPLTGLNPERLNDSLTVPAIMLAEELYKIAPLTSGERGREEYLTRIAGPKFRAPRWMAEKAMEVHRDMLAYLEAEFGLRFHEVDLASFPEDVSWQFVPEAVESVGRILNEQSLRIEALNAKLARRRWDRRLRRRLRAMLSA